MPSFWEIILISSSFISALYFLILRAGFRLYKQQSESTSGQSVSIVVAAHNEWENLQKLLPALLEQNHEDFEIIIALDRSTDGSLEYLNSLDDNRINPIEINEVPENINPKKNALNLAILQAKHPIILLTDADCLPCSNRWIKSIANSYRQETEFVIGYSGYKSYPGFLNKFIRYETLLTVMQYAGLGLLFRPYMGVGRNLSYRKETFIKNNGFEGIKGITGGDDDLFINRHASYKNTAFSLGTNAQTLSEPKRSWKTYFRQKTRHLSVGKHYKLTDKLILGGFSISNLTFWVTFVYIGITGDLILALAAYVLRLFTLSLTFTTARGILQENHSLWTLPVMDIFYWIYHSFTAVVAMVVKRTTWN